MVGKGRRLVGESCRFAFMDSSQKSKNKVKVNVCPEKQLFTREGVTKKAPLDDPGQVKTYVSVL